MGNHSLLLLLLLLGASLEVVVASDELQVPLRVGTWNIQDFGPTKMGKDEVVNVIVKVMRRFDLICIMEIVDKSQEVPADLLKSLNLGLIDTYSFLLSDRVGTSWAKEQYGCYWRPSRVSVVRDYQYNDTEARFSYDPFGVVVEVDLRNEVVRFGLVVVHTRPVDAEKEISALADVYDDFKNVTGTDKLIIAGDYNAGCTYVTSNEWPSIKLWTDDRFTWLISNHIDTTTKDTTCPYDRMVVAGENFQSYMYVNSAQPFYFDEVEGSNITNQDQLEDVSDHYPLEVLLPGGVPAEVEKVGPPSIAVSVDLNTSEEHIITMNTDLGGNCTGEIQEAVVVSWSASSVSLAMDSLSAFSSNHSSVVRSEAVSVLRYKVGQGVLQDHTLHGQWQDPTDYRITLLCRTSQGTCTLSLSARTALN